MKNRIMAIALAAVMLFALAGCGSDGEVNTEEADNTAVKNEFVQFIGTDIPEAEKTETEVMTKYNSYFTEGESVDSDALLTDLTDNLIPKYSEFLASVDAIEVSTDEVKNLKTLYYDAMDTQYQALQKVQTALQNEDKDVQTEAQQLLSDAKTKYTAYNDAVYALAQQENITLEGEIGTTSTTELATETNTQAINPDEDNFDDGITITESSETEAASETASEEDTSGQ